MLIVKNVTAFVFSSKRANIGMSDCVTTCVSCPVTCLFRGAVVFPGASVQLAHCVLQPRGKNSQTTNRRPML